MMTDMEIESLDYKLSRLKPGRSTCVKPGEWAYLTLDGSLHKLKNWGYYAPWGCDMWVSRCWMSGRWCSGTIGGTKRRLTLEIERSGPHPEWTRGFGKGGEATDQQERLA